MTLIACPPVSTTNAHRLQINLIHQHRPSETKREAERRENGSSPALLGLRFYLPACLSVKFPPRAVASVDSPRSKLPERYQTHKHTQTQTNKHTQTQIHKHTPSHGRKLCVAVCVCSQRHLRKGKEVRKQGSKEEVGG